MNKLNQLRAIRDHLMAGGMTNPEAVARIGLELNKQPSAVYKWLTASQVQPIQDNDLELLKLKLNFTPDLV